jgi:hypothetical protein
VDADCVGDLVCVHNTNVYSHLGQVLTLADIELNSLNTCMKHNTASRPTAQPTATPIHATKPSVTPTSAIQPSASPTQLTTATNRPSTYIGTSPTQSHSAAPSTNSHSEAGNDPECEMGVVAGHACCAKACGSSCWTVESCNAAAGGVSACCPGTNSTLFASRSCDEFEAPCLIADGPSQTGHETDMLSVSVGAGFLGLACTLALGVIYVKRRVREPEPNGARSHNRKDTQGAEVNVRYPFDCPQAQAQNASFGGTDFRWHASPFRSHNTAAAVPVPAMKSSKKRWIGRGAEHNGHLVAHML